MFVVCQIDCVGLIMWTKHVHAQSKAWTKKKCLLRNEKLEANRASETEQQIKERLRIRCENEK